MRKYQIGLSELVLDIGNILDLPAEVIVSSDDHMLSMGGGVSAVIGAAAGSAMMLDAAKAVPADVGDVIVTTAGALAARYVFHVVTIGPAHWQDRPSEDETHTLVREATRKCLRIADALGTRSIGFPALGTGAAGFSVAASAAAMAEVIDEVLGSSPTAFKVSIVLFYDIVASPMRHLSFYQGEM